MNNDNGFDLIIAVVFAMITQQRGLGTKYKYLVVSFCLGEGENLPQFHLRALQIRDEKFLLKYQAEQINNLTGKYIQLTGKCNKLHVIKSRRDKDIVITNIQESMCTLNQIRQIQVIGNKLISLPKKPQTQDHIGYVVKSPLRPRVIA